MKYILSLILLFFLLNGFAQDVKKEESILYVVDSIPIIKDPDKSSGTFKNEDIDHLDVVTNPDKIKALGYTEINKIIYITTKEFVKRPSEIKSIPTTKLMDRKNGVWYLKDATKPYSGRFIDYFLNGKIEGEGTLKDGVINGMHTVYYENGNKIYFRNYVNGIANGYSEEYFNNGDLKQKGNFKDGKDDGLWVDYYSTGIIKRQTNFINLLPDMSKDEKKFLDLQSKAVELMTAEDYKDAIKKLNEAEKLNGRYADLYFYRGTAELDSFDFDNAIVDFDKAIELEPLYMEALANRAFSRIRKYEFKDSRTLTNTKEVTVMAIKDKVKIPVDEKNKICNDLNKSVELGDDKDMVLDAIKNYCNIP
ncbi:MAG: repeat-containing protein [Mucilaginibacter sp.]|nr:repeat-containing protein [Mucilaginibacter sp.]